VHPFVLVQNARYMLVVVYFVVVVVVAGGHSVGDADMG